MSSRPWTILGVSTFAQTAASASMSGAPFLIPALHHQGLTVAQASLLVAAPVAGVMLTLVAWGWFADHVGERVALMAGLSLTVLADVGAAFAHSHLLLGICWLIAGASAAAVPSASGRVVVGWFPPHRRGLAMGIRQMAQPAGLAVASATLPAVAAAYDLRTALLIPAAFAAAALVAVAIWVVDPPRGERTAHVATNPYRGDLFLTRVHVVSVLLVIPQFVVWTFSLVWLVDGRGWAPAAAGLAVSIANLLGAFGRIAAGQLSDAVASRMRPIRWIAYAAAATMTILGLIAGGPIWVAVAVMFIASVLTVADNGLAFTAVAERAGPWWSGRALGVQNTSQFLASAIVAPLGGLAITHLGFGWTFGLAAIPALAAIALVPVRDERPLS
ncbi:putative major facilitator superfamily protein [Nocardioides baekrokdamisoli]|uniref:Putative major facilitator superfamily protein n=1 Tax=Nocardioides baekrokdamisoli TaxID=1804624 RepID=A0A3G9IY04_9ACTN|nr:MFS transporter [Nocardioides baekrokdamisoli]BBH17293.1 putative major facilitator superfamily protein [Nocardioides baekrokdamisoli]